MYRCKGQGTKCIRLRFKHTNTENKIIGPVVAKNDEMAMRIVHDLAKGHNGKLRIDVLEGKKDFMKVLEIAGFKR